MIEFLGWRNFDDVKSVYKMIDNLELLLWQRNGKDSAEERLATIKNSRSKKIENCLWQVLIF